MAEIHGSGARGQQPVVKMLLNGTAMTGMADHGAHSGSVLLGPARTAGRYRFLVVRDSYPGLLEVGRGGRSIEGELYEMPEELLRSQLLPVEPPELELGTIELADGEAVHAMLLRPERLAPGDSVVDISELGGFRAYRRHQAAQAGIDELLGRRPG